MADQTPLRAIFDDSGKVTGLGQYQLSDTIGVVDGGVHRGISDISEVAIDGFTRGHLAWLGHLARP